MPSIEALTAEAYNDLVAACRGEIYVVGDMG
jgi:hypothetical protein